MKTEKPQQASSNDGAPVPQKARFYKWFKRALTAFSLGAVFTLYFPGYLPGRRLNDREVKTLKRVFGDSIDYGSVKLHTLPNIMGSIGYAGLTIKKNDVFLHKAFIEGSLEKTNKDEQKIFFHEMAHVHNLQNNSASPRTLYYRDLIKNKFDHAATYAYGDKKYSEMNPEQQAEFLADYAADLLWYDSGFEEIRSSRKTGFVRLDIGLRMAPGVTLSGACYALESDYDFYDSGFPFDSSTKAPCDKLEKTKNDKKFYTRPEKEQWKILDKLILDNH